jgi:hypothetical protein
MSLYGSKQQKNKKRGSQEGSPEINRMILFAESPNGSPEINRMVLFADSPQKKFLIESPDGSPEINRMVLFADSLDERSPQTKGSPKRSPQTRWSPMRSLSGRSPMSSPQTRWSPMRSLAGGSPSKRSLRRTIQKGSESPQKEKFIETYFECSPIVESKSAKPLDSLYRFCKNLVKDNVFTLSPQPPIPSSSPIIGRGSLFSVRGPISPNRVPNRVEKTASIKSNQCANLDPESTSSACMTKKDMLELLHAIRKSHGNPQVAKVFAMRFSHVKKDEGVLIVEQEACSPLPKNMEGLIGLIKCVIELYQAGLTISDIKRANFMVTAEGLIVCVDPDLRESKKGVYKLVASGEYIHTIGFDVSEQFKQLILVFLETLGHPIVGDRKSAFRALYQQKGLLKSINLLSSEKSIYETTIEDFREVLRNIGLSEKDNAYLVGLLTPRSFQ